MAVHFNGLALIYHILQFFFPHGNQGFLDAVLVAVAVETGFHLVVDNQIHIPQQQLQNLLRGLSCIQHGGDGRDFLQLLLQLVQHLIGHEGHYLDNKAACLTHGVVFFHQNAQSYGGGHLFGSGKIVGDVLGNLAGLQFHLSHIGVFQSHILDDAEYAWAYNSAHIQLA